MSIRPVQVSLPTSPPAAPSRQGADHPGAPAAAQQAGAPLVAENASVAHAVQTGTISARHTVPVAAGVAAESGASRVSSEQLAAAIEKAQQAAKTQAQDFSFSVHDKTGEIVVKIIDRESKEVIRQIPAEEMLRLAERLQELEGKNKPGLLLKQEV